MTQTIKDALVAQNITPRTEMIEALASTGIKNFMAIRDIISFNTKEKKLKTPIKLGLDGFIILNNLSINEFELGSPDSEFIYFKYKVSSRGETLDINSSNGFVATIVMELFPDGTEVNYLIPEKGFKLL